MKLTDLDRNDTAQKALKANFGMNFDTSKLDPISTRTMLVKVRSLMKEAKSTPEFYNNQKNSTYMKLVFMEQALSKHYASVQRDARIIVENEEVEKSQVILAAQDMVDSIQKMVEEANDMLVKELPALVNSIQSEIGVNESTTFNQQATDTLTQLNQTLAQARTSMQEALNGITGQGGAGAFAPPVPGEEEIETDITAELPAEPEAGLPVEEPEAEPVGGAGRAKR